MSGTGSERAHGRERSLRGPLREPGSPLSASGSRSLAQGHSAVDAGGSGGGNRAIMPPLRNETGEDDVPTYEYKGEKCGEFEKEQRITDPELKKCPHCGGKAQRQVGGGGGFIRKGSNWVSKMSSSGDSPKKITDRMMKQTVGEVAEDIARGSKERFH